MRICFVVGEFPSLSHTFVLDQVGAFMAMGHEVRIVCDRLGTDPKFDFSAEPLRSLAGRTRRWWPTPEGFRTGLRRLPHSVNDKISTAADMYWTRPFNDCDVVLAHFGGNGLRLARARKRGRIEPPIVTIFHGNDVGLHRHSGTLGIYRPLFEYGSLLLTVNADFREALIEAGAAPERVAVHHMGVDCDEIAYRWRPWTDGPLEIVSVCRLVEKKGIEFALRALALLKERRPDVDWHYTIIGDGPLAGRLRSLASELAIDTRVDFLGAQPHRVVKEKLEDANVFLLPSVTAADGDVEGIPVALMEAAAAGLVVVSSRHSGIPELIEDGRCGFLSAERDVEGLSRSLEGIADDYTACRPLTLAARSHIETEFDNRLLHSALADRLSAVLPRERAA